MGRLLSEQKLLLGDASPLLEQLQKQAEGSIGLTDVEAGLPTRAEPLRPLSKSPTATKRLSVSAASLAEYEVTQLTRPSWSTVCTRPRRPRHLVLLRSLAHRHARLAGLDTDGHLAKYFPTSDLVTGQDILFFWVARMMMMQLAVVDDIPFDTVYLHGLVRDAKGKKMSKSTGNVVDPLDIIDEYGADALRFTNAAMASIGGVLKLDMKRIEGYRNFGNKLWQSHILAEMNGVFEVDCSTRPEPTHAVNKWIIGEVGRVRETVDRALTDFRFNDAAQALYAFFWGKVCNWYNEFTKPLFQNDDMRLETQQTMGWVLDQSLMLLHPIMPFMTEELWSNRDRAKMLVHADWPTYGGELVDEAADAEISWVISVIENIRSARAQMNVPAGAFVSLVQTEADAAARAAWSNNEALIKKMARVEALTEAERPRKAPSRSRPKAPPS